MIVSVVERYTVVSLTGAAGVLAPVTMLTVLELDLELDLVPALLLHVMEGLIKNLLDCICSRGFTALWCFDRYGAF